MGSDQKGGMRPGRFALAFRSLSVMRSFGVNVEEYAMEFTLRSGVASRKSVITLSDGGTTHDVKNSDWSLRAARRGICAARILSDVSLGI